MVTHTSCHLVPKRLEVDWMFEAIVVHQVVESRFFPADKPRGGLTLLEVVLTSRYQMDSDQVSNSNIEASLVGCQRFCRASDNVERPQVISSPDPVGSLTVLDLPLNLAEHLSEHFT